MDMDLARRRLMAALAAVSTGKNLNDYISIPGGIGEKVVLLHALNDAAAYLADEYFDPDGLALAQRALVALNIHCFSTREGAVAKAALADGGGADTIPDNRAERQRMSQA